MVSIVKPVKGIYLKDILIIPLWKQYIILGDITIEVQASQVPLGINRVEFFIDGKLMATDNEVPYHWTWSTFSFFRHSIVVTAYDMLGKSTQARISVWKFF